MDVAARVAGLDGPLSRGPPRPIFSGRRRPRQPPENDGWVPWRERRPATSATAATASAITAAAAAAAAGTPFAHCRCRCRRRRRAGGAPVAAVLAGAPWLERGWRRGFAAGHVPRKAPQAGAKPRSAVPNVTPLGGDARDREDAACRERQAGVVARGGCVGRSQQGFLQTPSPCHLTVARWGPSGNSLVETLVGRLRPGWRRRNEPVWLASGGGERPFSSAEQRVDGCQCQLLSGPRVRGWHATGCAMCAQDKTII